MLDYRQARRSEDNSSDAPVAQARLHRHPFGPFTLDITPSERIARLRSLRMAVLLMLRSHVDLVDALHRAEGDDAQLDRAYAEIEKLPALRRRHLLASYLQLWSTR